MEKLKELIKDPAVLEETIKGYWKKIDVNGEGSVSLADFKVRSEELAKAEGLTPLIKYDEGARERRLKILDPEGSGKTNFEAFKKYLHYSIDYYKKENSL